MRDETSAGYAAEADALVKQYESVRFLTSMHQFFI